MKIVRKYQSTKSFILILISVFAVSCATGDSPVNANDEIAEIPEKFELSSIVPEKQEAQLAKEDFPEIKEEARVHRFYWGNIFVGDVVAGIKKENDTYKFRAYLRSYNIAKLISKFKAETEGTVKESDKGYVQVNYKTHYERRKDNRNIELIYAPDGKQVVKDSNEPPEKRWKRKEVPADLKNSALNPVAGVFEARKKIIESVKIGKKEFTLPIYDGRRRGDFVFTINGKTKEGLIEVVFIEKPVAGYTDNELKEIKKGNKEITLYLSPQDYWPVLAKGHSPLGKASAKLVKTCATIEECLK